MWLALRAVWRPPWGEGSLHPVSVHAQPLGGQTQPERKLPQAEGHVTAFLCVVRPLLGPGPREAEATYARSLPCP